MSATNITSKCRIASIGPDDVMILPHDANLRRMKFSERTAQTSPQSCDDSTHRCDSQAGWDFRKATRVPSVRGTANRDGRELLDHVLIWKRSRPGAKV